VEEFRFVPARTWQWVFLLLKIYSAQNELLKHLQVLTGKEKRHRSGWWIILVGDVFIFWFA
jgi:hypothetical protein